MVGVSGRKSKSETLDLEQAGYGFVVVDPDDGLGEQVGDAEDLDGEIAGLDGDGVGGDQLVDLDRKSTRLNSSHTSVAR